MPNINSETKTETIQNRYQTEKIIGQGRLSTVYRARDLQTGRTVALKVLQPHLRTQASIVQRFKREMATVQRLDHGAIIRIFDIIETPEHLALSMEFAPGIDLKSWVQNHGPMPPTRTAKLAKTLLEALSQAHTRGVLHRDLNLANIIIDEPNDDRIEIIGFGLARVDELVGLTMHTRVLGTLETMAPEAVLGKPVDAQADLFSIGAILYELLTAKPLHDGRMSSGLAFATNDNYLEPIRATLQTALNNKHPELLQTIIRALAPDPTLRFATAAQMLDALLGNYDEATWTALENKPTRNCTQCKRPLLESTNTCVYCGHTPKYLIKDPGTDEYTIRILPPKTKSPRDSKELSPTQIRALYEIVFEHEDTQQIFQATPTDLAPPFILFDKLSNDDAKHIARLLKNKQILYNIIHPKSQSSELAELSRTESSLNGCFGLAANLFITGFVLSVVFFEHLKAVSPFLIFAVLCIAPFIISAGIYAMRASKNLSQKKSHAQRLATKDTLATKTLPEWFRFNMTQRTNQEIKGPWMFLATISILALLAWLTTQQIIGGFSTLGALVLTAAISLPAGWVASVHYETLFHKVFPSTDLPQEIAQDQATAHAQSFALIPGDLLAEQRQQSLPNLFPDEALSALKKLNDKALQQEFHDLLELSAQLFHDTRVPTHALKEALAPMFSYTATLLNQLAKLSKNTPRDSAEKILTALTALDTTLAKTSETHEVEALLARKITYLNQLDQLDQTIHQANVARNELLNVRATILDFQSQFSRAQLPSIEQVKEDIAELQIQSETRRELVELLENA